MTPEHSPEKNLWHAVFWRLASDYLGTTGGCSTRQEHDAVIAHARSVVEAHSGQHKRDFEELCNFLDYPPETVRKKLIAMRKKGRTIGKSRESHFSIRGGIGLTEARGERRELYIADSERILREVAKASGVRIEGIKGGRSPAATTAKHIWIKIFSDRGKGYSTHAVADLLGVVTVGMVCATLSRHDSKMKNKPAYAALYRDVMERLRGNRATKEAA